MRTLFVLFGLLGTSLALPFSMWSSNGPSGDHSQWNLGKYQRTPERPISPLESPHVVKTLEVILQRWKQDMQDLTNVLEVFTRSRNKPDGRNMPEIDDPLHKELESQSQQNGKTSKRLGKQRQEVTKMVKKDGMSEDNGENESSSKLPLKRVDGTKERGQRGEQRQRQTEKAVQSSPGQPLPETNVENQVLSTKNGPKKWTGQDKEGPAGDNGQLPKGQSNGDDKQSQVLPKKRGDGTKERARQGDQRQRTMDENTQADKTDTDTVGSDKEVNHGKLSGGAKSGLPSGTRSKKMGPTQTNDVNKTDEQIVGEGDIKEEEGKEDTDTPEDKTKTRGADTPRKRVNKAY